LTLLAVIDEGEFHVMIFRLATNSKATSLNSREDDAHQFAE
jgi:hypothetical protein